MREIQSLSRIITFVFLALPALLASPPISFASDARADLNAICRIPFETLKDSKTGEPFPLAAAFNENTRLPENLRGRYIVADLNSTDESGNCRGVEEYIAPVDGLSEFPRLRAIAIAQKTDLTSLAHKSLDALLASEASPGDAAGLATELEDLQNYLEQVQRYKTDPVVKPAVLSGHCVGQTLSFCEIVNGQPTLIYKFVTSSSRARPPLNRYYTPMMIINSRSWSSDRRYTPADARRDVRMGGGDARIIPFHNGGNPIEMPNFMHFLPAPGYTGETGNGIHQIAGGLDSGGTFGAPVSLGCIRLQKFESKLARWWIPRQAKFFVYFEPHRYYTYGDAKTGRAIGFQPASTPLNPPLAPAPSSALAPETNHPQARQDRSQFPLFPFFSLFQQ